MEARWMEARRRGWMDGGSNERLDRWRLAGWRFDGWKLDVSCKYKGIMSRAIHRDNI
jgi:hypothetical protein